MIGEVAGKLRIVCVAQLGLKCDPKIPEKYVQHVETSARGGYIPNDEKFSEMQAAAFERARFKNAVK